MDVTVKARQPVAINHRLLYPGETRVIPRGLAQQVMARYPGRLELVTPVAATGEPSAEPTPEPPLDAAAKPRRKGRGA